MKAAEATDSLRASSGKLADHNLPCTASDKKAERGGESFTASCAAGTSAYKLPNAHAQLTDVVKKGPAAGTVRHHDPDARRTPVLSNLIQTGGVKSKCAPVANAASMERRKRCSCSELSYVHSAINGSNYHITNYGNSCNCNVENCAWEEGLPALPLKSQPWRSSSDQSNTNAALHRALAAMKKVSGEPDAVKKVQPKLPIHHSRGGSDLRTCGDLDMNGRLITNSDARTLSMRERGRWGNSKMQQQLFAQPACAGGPGQSVKSNLMQSSERQSQPLHYHHQQALQHVQCLHCGSFSTTPVPGAAKGARSNSFGRKVRDYSWQQELLQEQKRPEQQVIKEAIGERQVAPNSGTQGAQIDATPHHRCDYARCADVFPDYEQGAAAMKLQHMQGNNVMSWQERYMLLCQAIAAGAFVDGGADDMSCPILPSRGYSWAVCECAACDVGCAAAGTAGFRHGPPGYCNTSSAERMMELEAFSGPLGYVSESKAGAELRSIMEKRPMGTRRRWWARLPSFGKSKSSVSIQTAATMGRAPSGQNTAPCSSCGQRVWRRGEEVEDHGERLCPDCIVRTGSNKCESGPLPGPTSARPTPPRATRPRPTPPFSTQHKQLPRRWRLMKLCRYLMGFPLQR